MFKKIKPPRIHQILLKNHFGSSITGRTRTEKTLMNKSKREHKIPNGKNIKPKKVSPLLRFLDEKRKTAPSPTATTATATPRYI